MSETKSSTKKSRAPALGIDLGTGFSNCCVFRHGKVEVIPNENGNRITPSVVSFTDTERLVGEGARNLLTTNPKNTLFEIKRLIGRRFSDPIVQQDIKNWPFTVVDDGKDKPMVEVEYEGKKKRFYPEEISAMVLAKMKKIAEDYLGCEVKDAVITVPAYFSDSQRSATRDAAIIAGLSVLKIINEPTAASLNFSLDKASETKERKVLIVDPGSGTTDYTCLVIQGQLNEVKSTGGDTHAGGADIDNILMNHFVKEFKTKYRKDITTSARAMARLKNACEKAKCTLSSSTEATIEIDSLFEGQDFHSKLSRARFNDLCHDFFTKLLAPLDQVLRDAKFSKAEIDDVVLIGGTSRIPKFQDMVKAYFNGKEPLKCLNPDEAVGIGASIMAAQLSGDDSKEIQDLLVLDVAPLSLGVEVAGGMLSKVVERNSTIPCKKSETFSTYSDNQTAVTIQIYEGERAMTKDCNRLGAFTLHGIPPMPRGCPQILVTFDIDASGILHVSAEEKKSGNRQQIKITNDTGRLTKEQIERMVAESEKFKEQDRIHKEKVDAKNHLEGYVYGIKNTLNDEKFRDKFDPADRKKLEATIAETQKWLDSADHATKEEFESKQKEVESICMPIMSRMYGGAGGVGGAPGGPSMSGMGGMSGMPRGGAGTGSSSGPRVDEVD